MSRKRRKVVLILVRLVMVVDRLVRVPLFSSSHILVTVRKRGGALSVWSGYLRLSTGCYSIK